MSYRDDLSALKAKLDEAEAELLTLRAENASLRRGVAPRVDGEGRVLGIPTQLRVERTLKGEVSASAHRELAAHVRSAIGQRGSVISLGRTLVVRVHGRREARAFQVKVTAKDGATRIVVEEPLGQVAGGLFGGIGGGLGLGGLGAALAPTMLAFGPWAALVAAPLWLVTVLGLTRALYGAIVDRRRAAHVELVGTLARAAQAAIDADAERAGAEANATAPAARVRVGESETEAPDEEPVATSSARARPATSAT